ncbi:hypothetical protein DIPPA_04963 [Diplonema papillatum]|nr:hypothetical protein DIPPA_04963 [Diplonema papillatum]
MPPPPHRGERFAPYRGGPRPGDRGSPRDNNVGRNSNPVNSRSAVRERETRERNLKRQRDHDMNRPRPAGGPSKGARGPSGTPGRGGPPSSTGSSRADRGPAQQTEYFLPFLSAERTASDMHYRNRQRRPVLQNASMLTSFGATFSKLPILSKLQKENEPSFKLEAETPVTVPKAAEGAETAYKTWTTVAPGEGQVAVRVLLLAPAGKGKNVFENFSLLCGKDNVTVDRSAMCYGGSVEVGSFDSIVEQTKKLLQEQTGADFSSVTTWHKLCEMTYDAMDEKAAYSTLYLFPDLTDSELAIKPFGETEEETYTVDVTVEEEIEVEVEKKEEEKTEEKTEDKTEEKKAEEGETAEKAEGDAAENIAEKEPEKKFEKKKVKKTVKETKTRQKTKLLITPQVVPLAQALNPDFCQNAERSEEMVAAVGILDDTLRAAMVNRIIRFLSRRKAMDEQAEADREVEKEKDQALADQLQQLKKQREEENEERLASHKETWAEEDNGQTEEDVAARAPERNEIKQAIRKELDEKYNELLKAATQAREAEKKRLVFEKNPFAVEAFEYFDRQYLPGKQRLTCPNRLTRSTLLNAFLATRTDLSRKEAMDLLELIPDRDEVDYSKICSVKRIKYAIEREEDSFIDRLEADEDEAAAQETAEDVEMDSGDEAEGEEADATAMDAEDAYSSLSYKELVALCKEKGLKAKGATSVLLQRLREADAGN